MVSLTVIHHCLTIERPPDQVFALLTGRGRERDLPDVRVLGSHEAVRRCIC